MDSVYEKLTAVFRDVFEDDSIVLTPELTASDIPEWDSLMHVRLIIAVQKAFGVRFAAARSASLKNVGELAELIRSHATAS